MIVTWHCGCRRDFQARGFGMHRRSCLFACMAWPTVVIPASEDLRAR